MRIAALVFAASALCALPAQSQISASRRPVFHKGFSYASWTADGYDSDTSDAQLAALKEGGVEWVAIVTHWLQASRSATELAPHPVRPAERISLGHASATSTSAHCFRP